MSRVVKSRLPWLYVNLLTAFMAAAVVMVNFLVDLSYAVVDPRIRVDR